MAWKTIPVLALTLVFVGDLKAQTPNPTSATNPFYGSVTVQPPSSETLALSLDDAVRRGLETNLGLKQAENAEKSIAGQKNQALQQFLPTVTFSGTTGYFEHDLAALGFSPAVAAQFSSAFPGGTSVSFPAVTRDDLTQAQLQFGQTLFSGPVIAAWRAAGSAQRAAYFSKLWARSEVVQQVAVAYLRAVADSSEVDNARALVAADRTAYDNARAKHLAGTVANLDELRARVQLQTRQQALVEAQNALDKDLILVKREIGIDPGQSIVLTDTTPYAGLALQTPEEIRAAAYRNRQDYRDLQNQAAELKSARNAYRAQRLPSLRFGGYFGLSQVSTIGAHEDFVLQGTLSIPIFREAGLRGGTQTAQAQLDSVLAQLDDLKEKIDQQVRSALLDVASAGDLVKVARSNVELATRALSDETDRVNAGVDDNLPLVTAQATLASAQSNLVQSLYQYNVSKLALARAAGLLEQEYRVYLGR